MASFHNIFPNLYFAPVSPLLPEPIKPPAPDLTLLADAIFKADYYSRLEDAVANEDPQETADLIFTAMIASRQLHMIKKKGKESGAFTSSLVKIKTIIERAREGSAFKEAALDRLDKWAARNMGIEKERCFTLPKKETPSVIQHRESYDQLLNEELKKQDEKLEPKFRAEGFTLLNAPKEYYSPLSLLFSIGSLQYLKDIEFSLLLGNTENFKKLIQFQIDRLHQADLKGAFFPLVKLCQEKEYEKDLLLTLIAQKFPETHAQLGSEPSLDEERALIGYYQSFNTDYLSVQRELLAEPSYIKQQKSPLSIDPAIKKVRPKKNETRLSPGESIAWTQPK